MAILIVVLFQLIGIALKVVHQLQLLFANATDRISTTDVDEASPEYIVKRFIRVQLFTLIGSAVILLLDLAIHLLLFVGHFDLTKLYTFTLQGHAITLTYNFIYLLISAGVSLTLGYSGQYLVYLVFDKVVDKAKSKIGGL